MDAIKNRYYQSLVDSYEKKIKTFSVENLSLHYNYKSILSHLSFQVHPGQLLSVMGPNGGGKTTLFQTLAGLHKGFSGTWGWKDPEKDQLEVAKRWSYLPQRFEGDRTFPLTVGEVVAMGSSKGHKAEIEEALVSVKLWEMRNTPLSHLSGGQFQRMLFARLAVQNAPLMLLDEPFAGVDEGAIQDLMALILRWAERGRVILVSQHNQRRARTYFPMTLLLAKDFHHWGPTEEVLDLPQWQPLHAHTQAPECC